MICSGLFLHSRKAFAKQVAHRFRQKKGKDMFQQQARSPFVRGSGTPASERMNVPGCLAEAHARLKLKEGPTAQSAVQQWQRIKSQVGLIYDRDGTSFTPSLGRRRTTYHLGVRVNTRWKRRIVRRKRTFFSSGYAKKMDVLEFTSRTKERRIFTHRTWKAGSGA